MPNANLIKAQLNLHLIVFIWGFTAILGALITIKEVQMVWFRMGLAGVFVLLYLLVTKQKFRLPWPKIVKLSLCGVLIAIHWIFFFRAINISNVSITLAIFSTGSFFASLLEPIFYKRKIRWHECLFGLIIIGGLYYILNVELRFLNGILCALFSIIVGVIFTLINGKFVQQYQPSVIALYEFFAGFIFISIYLLFTNEFSTDFFVISIADWGYLVLLASICSAYAFTASINVMKKLSPYTVMLTTNLEPVYGIILAYFILGDAEEMSTTFYIGSLLILVTVLINGYLQQKYQSEDK